MYKYILSLITLCSLSFGEVVKGTFTDPRDGQTYATLEFSGRKWMAQNLNFKTARSYCYDEKPANCKKFGRLYTYFDADTVCPTGWRLTRESDISALEKYTGVDAHGSSGFSKNIQLFANKEWDKLPKKGRFGYGERFSNGTDDFGIGLLPSGNIKWGNFGGQQNIYYWLESNPDYALYWYYMTYNGEMNITYRSADNGTYYSVRCVADLPNEKFVDPRDGMEYETITVGDQTWFAENLNYVPSNGGNSWCYGNNERYCKEYGRLYDWGTAVTACPDGWTLPEEKDFKSFLSEAGGAGSLVSGPFKMKPSGRYIFRGGEFKDAGKVGYFWTFGKNYKCHMEQMLRFDYNTEWFTAGNCTRGETSIAYPVRCVRDASGEHSAIVKTMGKPAQVSDIPDTHRPGALGEAAMEDGLGAAIQEQMRAAQQEDEEYQELLKSLNRPAHIEP